MGIERKDIFVRTWSKHYKSLWHIATIIQTKILKLQALNIK